MKRCGKIKSVDLTAFNGFIFKKNKNIKVTYYIKKGPSEIFKMCRKSLCNITVKEAFTFYLSVTYEIFLSVIVLFSD